MPAYELFAATTTNLFIQNIKTQAEAYGWTIDYFVAGRLHLHNAANAHFEIYASSTFIGIRGCTGYASGESTANQPGVSGIVLFPASGVHFIVVGPRAITVKECPGSGIYMVQFGSVANPVGVWSGGVMISSGHATGYTNYLEGHRYGLWSASLTMPIAGVASQVLINGVWSTLTPTSGGGVTGISESELYTKMPFAYSGGILPCPILLVQFNAVTTTNRHPIGYSPDVMYFNGGNVYGQLEEITINGEKWIAINQEEGGGTFATTPNLLLRLAA